MTGFGEGNFESKTLSVKISIRSLNHRFLDWNFRGNQIDEVENNLRAQCIKKIQRGRIEVSVELDFLDSSRWDLRFNKELLSKIMNSLKQVPAVKGKKFSFSVDDLFSIPHVISLKRKKLRKEEVEFLEKCFEKTLEDLIKMRTREGRELKRGIQIHLQRIGKALNRIEKLAKSQPFLIKDKLKNRLIELGQETPVLEEKFIKETAYLAQRFDLNEEIVRLHSHLKYAQELLSHKSEESAGRKLDFIAQELYREVNTISSKAQDIDIIKETLSIKGDVENIRQQAQNLE